jgi:hypothetical protein
MGADVAVKVKHPGVDEQARRFACVLSKVLRAVEHFVTVPFAFLLKEFLLNIHIQLDFTHEVKNTQKIRDHFVNETHLIIPQVHAYSERFIIMSYHDGTPFHDIKDDKLRRMISIDMYLFVLSSMVNFDLMHCDLHVGNWKVSVHDDGSYKFIVYDFGLMATIGDAATIKSVVLALFNDDFVDIARVLVPHFDSQPLGPELMDYIHVISKKQVVSYADRYTAMLRKGLIMGIPFNVNVLRAVQGILMCMQVVNLTRTALSKVLGKNGNCKEVMMCYNVGLLRKIGKYSALKEVLEQWIADDPNNRTIFEKWLDDTFGHTDESVFVDITVDGPTM